MAGLTIQAELGTIEQFQIELMAPSIPQVSDSIQQTLDIVLDESKATVLSIITEVLPPGP